jgi:hypothetical protein
MCLITLHDCNFDETGARRGQSGVRTAILSRLEPVNSLYCRVSSVYLQSWGVEFRTPAGAGGKRVSRCDPPAYVGEHHDVTRHPASTTPPNTQYRSLGRDRRDSRLGDVGAPLPDPGREVCDRCNRHPPSDPHTRRSPFTSDHCNIDYVSNRSLGRPPDFPSRTATLQGTPAVRSVQFFRIAAQTESYGRKSNRGGSSSELPSVDSSGAVTKLR